jgi:UDP-N-acetylmuramate: L-alanyl-gamma-D-glutamyl-meso-diaminopimelate ligase
MNAADHALVYYSPEVVAHKKLDALSVEDVQKAFGDNVVVKNTTASVLEYVYEVTDDNCVLLMMSSGNFDGIDYDALGTELSA